VFIKFSSHRSRETALRILGYTAAVPPQCYYSWARDTGKGTYDLTPEQVAAITGEHLVHFTKLQGPFDDLQRCWCLLW